jgi:tetratricopeptide (TPR) repeat protein
VSLWAEPLLKRGAFDEVFSGLTQFEREHLDGAELLAWYELRGASAYRLGLRAEARQTFEEGVGRLTNAGTLRFGLGQEMEVLGDIDRAVEQWRQVSLRNSTAQHLLTIARYLYLWDRLEDARLSLAPIFEAYYELKIMDDTFLYIRGLPSYWTTYETFAACAVVQGDVAAALAEIDRATKRLADFDFASLREVTRAYQTDDWREVLASDERALAKWDARFPSGMPRVRRAAIAGRNAPTLAGAVALIDEVHLEPNDFAWLHDVQTVLRAEAAHRFGDANLEERHLALFLERQQLLFEPQWAFDFGFLRYQETLKPAYQRRRRGA